MKLRNALLWCGLLLSTPFAYADESGTSSITEPYRWLTGKPTVKDVPASPDPLVTYRWPLPTASDNLDF